MGGLAVQSVVDVLQTPHLVLQMMDHAVYTANKVIMTSYPYTVK